MSVTGRGRPKPGPILFPVTSVNTIPTQYRLERSCPLFARELPPGGRGEHTSQIQQACEWSEFTAAEADQQSVSTPTCIKRPLDLNEPLHRAIKKRAAEDGVTMVQELRKLLSKHYCIPEATP